MHEMKTRTNLDGVNASEKGRGIENEKVKTWKISLTNLVQRILPY